jgi:hypothetical protein
MSGWQSKKIVARMRLKEDGTWENIYKDDFVELGPLGLAETFAMRNDPKRYKTAMDQVAAMEELKEMLVEAVMEKTGFEEANAVIQRIMSK